MKKILFSIILMFGTFSLLGVENIVAAEQTNQIKDSKIEVLANKNSLVTKENQVKMHKEINEKLSETEFDLNSSEIQEKQITLSNNEKVTVGVVPEHNSMLRVSNGSHKVYFYSGIANVTFKVRVSNNRITRAYDPWYIILGASVKSDTLKVDNSKQATYYFKFKTPVWEFGGWTGWVRANINSSNKLVVSIK